MLLVYGPHFDQCFPMVLTRRTAKRCINNAIKLAYNPSKAQRDLLYPLRINSLLINLALAFFFGDKTALHFFRI